MVLLLAALLAYHRSYSKGNQVTEDCKSSNDEGKEGEEGGDISLNSLRSQLSEHLSFGSDIIRTTVLRCHEGGGSNYDLDDDPSQSIEEEEPSRKRINSMNSNNNNKNNNNNNNNMDTERGNGSCNSPQSCCSDIFRPSVREEWIDAVFGREFFANSQYEAPRQGVGMSNIPSYVTYTATIPSDAKGEKLGMTLSRLPLGLYARHIAPNSEAFLAGVQENSILVDINGMGMLVEPSRQALERIWQYEGHIDDNVEQLSEDDQKSSASGATSTSAASSADSVHPSLREPVAFTFFKDGQLYTVVMLSNPPYGISWAPCGNFALVSRSYSFAATVGVRRGSIIAAVNDKNIRTMDHQLAAEELRHLFNSGEEIRLTLCYPPAAARTGFFERQAVQEGATKKLPPASSTDGVEVKFHSLEQSFNGFWGCGIRKPEKSDLSGSVAELAKQVASGEIEAPTNVLSKRTGDYNHHSTLRYHWSKKQRAFPPCPPLTKEGLQRAWDPLDALFFCIRLHQVSHNEEMLASPSSSCLDSPVTPKSALGSLHTLAAQPDAAEIVDLFLLQFVSLICLHVAPERSDVHSEEKKAEEHHEQKVSRSQSNDGELTGILLKLSRRDQDFSQRLYFLLRSYIAAFQDRPELAEKNSRNLLALLHCLDMLRSAEKRQSPSDLIDLPHIASHTESTGHDMAESQSFLTSEKTFSSSLSLHSQDSSSPKRATSLPSSSSLNATTSEKKRTLFRFMRKSGRRKSTNSAPTKTRREMQKISRVVVKKQQTEMPLPSHADIHQSMIHNDSHLDLASLYDNMTAFLGELDNICSEIERLLLKSFSEKITDWALQPWSASKGSVLATLTEGMRESLRKTDGSKRQVLINPIISSELLVSVQSEECYILPSAHFPLLLTFNVRDRQQQLDDKAISSSNSTVGIMGGDKLYSTNVEIVGLRGNISSESSSTTASLSYVVHGAIAGTIEQSGRSLRTDGPSSAHVWYKANELKFNTRSSWGAPQTLSLRLSTVSVPEESQDKATNAEEAEVVGFCWVDLTSLWQRFESTKRVEKNLCHVQVWSRESMGSFDDHGNPDLGSSCEPLEIELKISTEVIDFDNSGDRMIGSPLRQRMLLYKHDDDLRQEAFAIQFIKVCDKILKSSGLDLKLLTFGCVPVGSRRGFIEWVPGSVPLSEICQPFAGSILAESSGRGRCPSAISNEDPLSMIAKAGLKKYGSLHRIGGMQKRGPRGCFSNNPIQSFLRSVAYDPDAPYLIKRECMDTYVKSCAGFCVITYLLGVGDRHLDNLLIHESGCFFHCDYSFIFGKDPKKYQPMRMTEDMVHGMGGRKSDNYAKFLSLTGAAFLALRRPESVRFLLSLVRLMEASRLPDLSSESAVADVILGIRERMRLDLGDDKAVAFMEKMIENSLSSKMWIAVDAIHSLGKRF